MFRFSLASTIALFMLMLASLVRAQTAPSQQAGAVKDQKAAPRSAT